MKNIFLKLLFSLVPVLGLSIACTKGNDQDDSPDDGHITELTGQVASLEGQVKALEATVAALEKTTAEADSRLRQDLEKEYESLSEKFREISGEIEEIIGEIGNTNGKLEDLDGKLDGLASEEDLRSLAGLLSALEQEVSEKHQALAGKIEEAVRELGKQLDTKLNETQVKVLLQELQADFDGELAKLHAEIEACREIISGLTGSIAAMQGQVDAMQATLQASIDGKVDRTDFDNFVYQTNEQIQTTGTLLSRLLAACEGFGETPVKAYIDEAVASLTSALDDYVLKETYQQFIAEYGRFQEEIEGRMTTNEGKINSLELMIKTLTELIENAGNGSVQVGDLTSLVGRVAGLEAKVTALEQDLVTLEQIQAQFDKGNKAFFDGVGAILDDALAEGGVISEAIARSAETLRNEYTEGLAALSERIDGLEERVTGIEGKLEDILNRIQSLVYVPKTSDGKIHIGATYIAETDENGNAVGDRIEVTPTKKLEYRVSPADLRDKLLELPTENFFFYQEHVTRAAEGSGMDEFHITKIEEGNGPGEILITVQNDHDFTHEDLAVALCIKGTTANGVATEFTSSYTTVIDDGRNIRDRFYMARQYNGQWIVSRDDIISYLLRYDDLNSSVLLSPGDYRVVYDTGESILTIEEAKERFEWEADLTASVAPIAGGFSTSGIQSGSFTVSPTTPNTNRSTPATFKLKTAAAGNIRGKASDKYSVSLSDGKSSISLIPEVTTNIVIVGSSYTVDAAEITWNYSKWDAGKKTGNTEYRTDFVNIASTVGSASLRSDLSYIPAGDLKEIFAENAEWTVTKQAGSTMLGDITVVNSAPQSDGNTRKVQFAVKGYIFSIGKEQLSLSRTVKPSGLVGSEGIQLTATVNVTAPEADKTVVIDVATKSKKQDEFIFYFTISDNIENKSKILSYSDEEIKQFFDGSKIHVSSMLSMGALAGGNAWQTADGTSSLPVRMQLGRNEETGSLSIVACLVAYPAQIKPDYTGPEPLTFTAPEDCSWVIPYGPTIPITGSVTVSAAD